MIARFEQYIAAALAAMAALMRVNTERLKKEAVAAENLAMPFVAVVALTAGDVSESLEGWTQLYDRWHIDEFVVPIVLAFGVFSWRRRRTLEREIAWRQRAEDKLRKSEERFRSLVQNASDIITVLEADGTIHYASPALERVLGYWSEEIVGNSAFDYVHPDDLEEACRIFTRILSEPGVHPPLEFRVPHKDGSWRHLEYVVNNLLDDPSVRGVVVNQRDITSRKLLEEQLKHQAFHDALTGLPNRPLLLDRLQQALARTDRRENSVAVLFLDLDGFKQVNDSLGHEAGDNLLVGVAERLRACVRPEDTVARLGGDEFVILLEDIEGADEATQVAERLAQKLEAPFSITGEEVYVTTSVGIALSTMARDLPEEILCDADAAMYRAKDKGKARHEIFAPSMDGRIIERQSLCLERMSK